MPQHTGNTTTTPAQEQRSTQPVPRQLQRDEPTPFGVDAYDDIPDRLDDWDLT